jgi:hypothetical protein
MVSEPRKPWDRLPEEPATMFSRFLCYLHLGPTRSLEAAYRAWHGAQQGTEGHNPPAASSGAWRRAAKAFKWRERALAFDLANMEAGGLEALVAFSETISRAIAKLLGSLDSMAPPTSWKEFTEVLHGLSPYISPDLLRRFQSRQAPEPTANGGAAPSHSGA